MGVPYVSLGDFAATFDERGDSAPEWAYPGSTVPPILHTPEVQTRVEEVLDTVVAVQRATWLQDGVYVGPQAMSSVYGDVLDCARELRIAVPPAVVAGCSIRSQGVFGTDSRAFLYLSSFFFTESAAPEQRRFQAGRLCGHIAAQQVTAATLYAVVVDDRGLRSAVRRAVGPVLEFVMAPLSVGVRLALSRWHRAAEITADRAGLLCAGSLQGASNAMLRTALGVNPRVDPSRYLDQLRASRGAQDPGKWTELLNDQPWTHKRMRALELFSRSALWADLTGEEVSDPLDRDALERQTAALMGVS